MNKKLIGYALVIFAGLSAVNAQAFTITFEDIPYSRLGSGPVYVSTYSNDGFDVSFSYGTNYVGFNNPLGTEYGRVGISSDYLPIPGGTGYGPGQDFLDITAQFSKSASFVSIFAKTETTSDTIKPTLSAYDSSGNLLGSTSYKFSDGNSQLTTLSLSASGIRSIKLTGQQYRYVLGQYYSGGFPGSYDDLTITPEVAPVPLPASAWMLLSGLGGLGLLAKKRKGAK